MLPPALISLLVLCAPTAPSSGAPLPPPKRLASTPSWPTVSRGSPRLEGGHWLGTFAVYLVTHRGLPQAPALSRP